MRKGWYRKRAHHVLFNTENSPRALLAKEWEDASSLGRIELYPYRSLKSGNIPDLIALLNENGVFLPSQRLALELLANIIFYDQEVRVAARAEGEWRTSLEKIIEPSSLSTDIPAFALKFNSQSVYLTKRNLSLK